jgi:predicted DsbA family dithiol-disulfide isomerase
MSSRIEVFADIVCPFTHVALRRLAETRRSLNASTRLRIRAWPLELVNGAPVAYDVARAEADALREAVSPDLFAGLHEATWPRTSIPAFGLVAAAYNVDDHVGEAVSLALRDALFEHGLDVADAEVLRTIGARYDVEPVDAHTAEAAVRADLERGKARAVQGSPHFFVGDRDWFCPSLDIHHVGDHVDVTVDGDTMREFYAAAFG